MAKLPSAQSTAQLILINARRYELERPERRVERYRMSTSTLRRIARRELLRATFLRDVEEALAAYGWLWVQLHNEWAVISVSKIDSWMKLSSKRLDDYRGWSEAQIEELFDDLFPPAPEDDDDAATV